MPTPAPSPVEPWRWGWQILRPKAVQGRRGLSRQLLDAAAAGQVKRAQGAGVPRCPSRRTSRQSPHLLVSN